jgi:hypothetical protein
LSFGEQAREKKSQEVNHEGSSHTSRLPETRFHASRLNSVSYVIASNYQARTSTPSSSGGLDLNAPGHDKPAAFSCKVFT